MLISVRATAAYDLADETFLLLMVEPPLVGRAHRVEQAQLLTTPTPFHELGTDVYGNPQRRIIAPKGSFSFEFTATIETAPNATLPDDAVEHPLREVPAEALVFTLPSRYCQSDLLARMARGEFGQLPSGGGRVRTLAGWVRQHVEYHYGTTDAKTSAFDTATERIGVCRDFAHLVIAFCRALGIPARYASCYAPGLEPPDFHSVAQVYLSGAWHNVDATTDAVRPALIPIAVGRDAADVAMTTLWGLGKVLKQTVEVRKISG